MPGYWELTMQATQMWIDLKPLGYLARRCQKNTCSLFLLSRDYTGSSLHTFPRNQMQAMVPMQRDVRLNVKGPLEVLRISVFCNLCVYLTDVVANQFGGHRLFNSIGSQLCDFH